MVRMRNLVKVGNREVKKRYVGNKLIFEDLGDKTEVISGEEIYTDKADDSVVHVEIDGKSVQEGEPTPDHPIEIHSLNDFDVVSSVGKRNLLIDKENANHPLIDKINLLLDEPLRSVGDVKDRIFRDTDGLWKVERNIGETVFDGSEVWTYQDTDRTYYTSSKHVDITSGRVVSSHYVENETTEEIGEIRFNWNMSNILLNHDNGAMGVSGYKNWLSDNSVTILYTIAPMIETLPQELQDNLNNLRSFQDSNHVYTTAAENLKPTLHTTFKSKGWYDYYLKTLLK